MMMRPRALAVLLAAATLVLVAPDAAAQDATTTGTATVLFDEAVALMERGKFVEACPKLARSNELSPNGGTLFALAECYERSGRIASAWVTYKEAAIRAAAAKRVDAEKRATDSAERLAPNVSRLQIYVSPAAGVEGLAIELDGRPVARAEWGIATPIDPGPHKLRISAPGRLTTTRDIAFDRVAAQKRIAIPELDLAPAESAAAPASPNEGAPRGGTQRVLGIAIAGVGLAGIAVGAVFGLQASSKNDDAAAHCRGNLCDAEGIRLDGQGRDDATISTIAFIAGGALAAGGLVVLLTAPSGREKPASTASLGVRVGGGVGKGGTPTVTLGATF
jgi:serine/threonine-protein kinase